MQKSCLDNNVRCTTQISRYVFQSKKNKLSIQQKEEKCIIFYWKKFWVDFHVGKEFSLSNGEKFFGKMRFSRFHFARWKWERFMSTSWNCLMLVYDENLMLLWSVTFAIVYSNIQKCSRHTRLLLLSASPKIFIRDSIDVRNVCENCVVVRLIHICCDILSLKRQKNEVKVLGIRSR